MSDALQGLDKRLQAVTKTTQQATKAASGAMKVTRAVATLLAFDEINRLKEKTVSVSGAKSAAGKEKTGQTEVYEIDAQFRRPPRELATDFIARFRMGVQEADDGGVFAGENFITRFGRGIVNALGSAADWLRRNLWNPLQAGWTSMGALSVELGARLSTSAGELWNGFRNAWQLGGDRIVSIANTLINPAQTLWQGFAQGWGTRSVGVVNSLVSSAQTLWQRFSDGWGVRGVSVVNTLKNSAASLWEEFKAGWAGRVLGLRLSYDANVTGLKKTVCKALGLSGWPTLSFAARGGIVDRATLIGRNLVAGEDGAEAIIPLERHTEWMDKVADRISAKLSGPAGSGEGANIHVTVTLDGRVVGESTVKYIRSEARAGRDPLGAYL